MAALSSKHAEALSYLSHAMPFTVELIPSEYSIVLQEALGLFSAGPIASREAVEDLHSDVNCVVCLAKSC